MLTDELATNLRGDIIEKKNSSQINFRGEIDSLYAQAVFTCAYARQYGYTDILSGLEDIVRVIKEIMRAEALGVAPKIENILGLNFDELREVSNHPKTELGIEHTLPDDKSDDMTALINVLRAETRRCERAAVTAYEDGGAPYNKDIQLLLNRLSSAIYILMLEHIASRDF